MRSAAQVFALVLVVAADAGAPPLLPPQSVLPAGSLTVIAAAQFGVAYLDPMSSNSTTAHAAASSSAATPAQAADDAEAVEAARQRRLAVLEREQRADQPAAQLSDVMLAPAKYTSVRSSGFQKLDEHSYHVQMGQLNAFLLTNGPAEVCRYNFNKVGGMHKKDLAQRLHCTSGPRVVYDHDDTFELTRKGQKKLDMNGERDLKCYALDLVCTGRSEYGVEGPNCTRVCCGGPGMCIAGCAGPSKHQYCGFRVRIFASLQLVADGKLLVTLSGSHVPSGQMPIPPPLNGLRAAPSVMRALADNCIGGIDKPMGAVERAAEELRAAPSNAPTAVAVASAVSSTAPPPPAAAAVAVAQLSTRFAPPRSSVARRTAYMKSVARGGGEADDDATRCDQIIRRQLIPKGRCLLYEQGVVVVIATEESLDVARLEVHHMVVSDAKVDTTTGARSCWSSMRGRCATTGRFQPIAAWIAPEETIETIQKAARAIRMNVRCSDPNCSHELVSRYGNDGSWSTCRQCAGWWRPSVGIDKHWASYRAFGLAGYGRLFLCDWHGFCCFTKKCDDLRLTGNVVNDLAWSFRLIKRADSESLAFQLYAAFVDFVCALATSPVAPYTLEVANDLCAYPRVVLLSWIDGPRLHHPGFCSTTGACEGAHAEFDRHHLKQERNRLVSNIVAITGGFELDGTPAKRSFFDLAARRHSDRTVQGARRPSSDVRLRQMKAALNFLHLGRSSSCVIDAGNCTLVPASNGGDECLRRHAELSGESRRGAVPSLNPLLTPALKLLSHGGEASFSRAGYYSVQNETGRCECVDSTYHGVCSAVSPCKHEYLRLLEWDAEPSPSHLAELRAQAAAEAAVYVAVAEDASAIVVTQVLDMSTVKGREAAAPYMDQLVDFAKSVTVDDAYEDYHVEKEAAKVVAAYEKHENYLVVLAHVDGRLVGVAAATSMVGEDNNSCSRRSTAYMKVYLVHDDYRYGSGFRVGDFTLSDVLFVALETFVCEETNLTKIVADLPGCLTVAGEKMYVGRFGFVVSTLPEATKERKQFTKDLSKADAFVPTPAPLTPDAAAAAAFFERNRAAELIAAARQDARAAVERRCGCELMAYVYWRERTKPRGTRCLPLYRASVADVDTLLEALRVHPSIPNTGKGTPAAPEAPPPPALEEEEAPPPPGYGEAPDVDDDIFDDEEALPPSELRAKQKATEEEEAAEAAAAFAEDVFAPQETVDAAAAAAAAKAAAVEEQAVEMSCDIPRASCNDLGLRFHEVEGAKGRAVVSAWAQRASGSVGPPRSTGQRLLPGDILLSCDGDTELVITDKGVLWLPPPPPPPRAVAATVKFIFLRPRAVEGAKPLGGRPGKKGAKFKRKAALGSSSLGSELEGSLRGEPPPAERDPGLAGGRQPVNGKKPQRKRASDKPAGAAVEQEGDLEARAEAIRECHRILLSEAEEIALESDLTAKQTRYID